MKMLGVVPIYFDTDDKRIIHYLMRNARAHELKTGTTAVKWSQQIMRSAIPAGKINLIGQIRRKAPRGNGNIRALLLILSSIAVWTFLLSVLIS